MRFFTAGVVFFGMGCGGFAQSAAPVIEALPWSAPAGAEQIWDGKDIAGLAATFKGGGAAPEGYWKVAGDGSLALSGSTPFYLRTEKVFSNYHFHVEWKWEGKAAKGTNNSGIFVMQHPPDVVWPYSVQVQVKVGATGDLIAQGGLLFAPGDTNLTRKKLADSNEKEIGQWNATDIYCKGASIEVYENGLRQNFVDKLPTDSGQVALQYEGYPIDFKNVWIEPLK